MRRGDDNSASPPPVSAEVSPQKQASPARARDQRFRNLMAKIRVPDKEWLEPNNLKQVFLAQRAITREFVDVVSYFGGTRLDQIEDSNLRQSMFFKPKAEPLGERPTEQMTASPPTVTKQPSPNQKPQCLTEVADKENVHCLLGQSVSPKAAQKAQKGLLVSLIEVDLSNQKSHKTKPKIKKLKNSKARSFILLQNPESHNSNTSFGDGGLAGTNAEANFQTLLTMASNSSMMNLKKKPAKKKKKFKKPRSTSQTNWSVGSFRSQASN